MRFRAVSCECVAGLSLVVAVPGSMGAENFRPMGTLGGLFSEALGVADNGVGVGTTEDAAFRTRAVRITPGLLEDLGTLGGPYSEGDDISTDGGVFVGGAYYLSNRQHAFRWTEAGGMQDLGELIGPLSFGAGVDATGTVITGWGVNAQALMLAFRWTQADGMTNLGTLGGDRSTGLGVSGDGGTIVGSAREASGFTRAFR